MSRGVKDLREMLVVSRLTCRDSDSESDDGRAGMITPFESLDISDSQQASSNYNHLNGSIKESKTPTPPSSADSGLGRRKKKRKKPKGYNAASRGQYAMYSAMSPVTELHAFPKARPLPAVGESCMNDLGSRTESSSSGDSLNLAPSESTRKDFSEIIPYIDQDIVAEWLERSNQNLKDLTTWCTDLNFVKFAQFWITEFGVERRCEILSLELSILLDEMTLAFRSGQEQGKVRSKDIMDLLSALLREYPKKLTGAAGVYLFLDYLDVFTSERALEYRNILSDVKLSTRNKDHVQLILATRSFMLINVWVAIVTFYKQVTDASSKATSSPEHLTKYREKSDINYSRLVEAINNGHTEVVHYFLFSGKISAGHVDSRQKSLLHIATAANQLRVVEYLLKKWTGCMDVNMACDTGNAPLHVAVNLGNYNLVRALLNMPDIEVNKENSLCDDATPLHLAVLHGNIDIVRMLFKCRADPYKLIGGQTIIDLARDFGHDDIVDLLLGTKD